MIFFINTPVLYSVGLLKVKYDNLITEENIISILYVSYCKLAMR